MQLSTVVDTVSQYIFFVNMDEIMDTHDIHTHIYIYIYIYFLMFVGKLTFNIFFILLSASEDPHFLREDIHAHWI